MLDYWWILPPLLYGALLVFVIRRGLWETVGRKILLAAICVFILLIPATRWAQGYPFAVLTVINLLLYVAAGNRQSRTKLERNHA
ncbi:hypothetical protein [Mycobacterium sp. 141]|uniref:hypothetical protein n=1 Tax=Mycobacterium sp. 141 TaxID=1120797 RepID=UPI0012DE0415|nr:hypothetical protein [Mycobacterium sp. 141]